ncbi:hypothetical protein EBS80_03510 [bacterium]|nr:hypothetical protein [bacterium]
MAFRRLVPSIVAREAGVILFLVNADPNDRRVPNLADLAPIVQIVYSQEAAVTALRELGVHRHEIRRVRARLATNDVPVASDPKSAWPRASVRFVGALAGKLFALHGKHSVERAWDESRFVPAEAVPDALAFVYGYVTARDAVLYGFIDGDMTVGLAVFYAADAFDEVMTDLFFHRNERPFDFNNGGYGEDTFAVDVPISLSHDDRALVWHDVIRHSQVGHLPRMVDGSSHAVIRGFPAFYVCELMRLEAGFAPELPPGLRPPIRWPDGLVARVNRRSAAIARENLIITGKPGHAPV